MHNTGNRDVKLRTVDVADKIVKQKIWDGKPQSPQIGDYETIGGPSAYEDKHAIIVTFDLTNRESYVGVKAWLQEIHQYGPEDAVRILVATKADLENEREVSKQDIADFADQHNMQVFETSAKTNDGIEQAFVYLAEKALEVKGIEVKPINEERHKKRQPHINECKSF